MLYNNPAEQTLLLPHLFLLLIVQNSLVSSKIKYQHTTILVFFKTEIYLSKVVKQKTINPNIDHTNITGCSLSTHDTTDRNVYAIHLNP
jgi:hypothetical protein